MNRTNSRVKREETPVHAEPVTGPQEETTDEKKVSRRSARTYLIVFLVLAAVFYVGVRYAIARKGNAAYFYRELIPATEQTRESAASVPEPAKKINVNTAGKAELASLPGIGESRAEKIIAFRNNYGLMTQAEDLLKIDGIGEGILEQILPYVTFETSP